MLILITGSKSGFGDDFGQYDTKTIIFHRFWPNASQNSVAMATPKIPGDQKLFERMCYMLKLKVTKFQLPIVSQLSKCLKFMTFREGCFVILVECKYFNEALETFYHHQFYKR